MIIIIIIIIILLVWKFIFKSVKVIKFQNDTGVEYQEQENKAEA